MDYLGTLAPSDPLQYFLIYHILERQLGVISHNACFDVHRLHHTGAVLRYTDRHSGVSVVGKFFAQKSRLDGTRLGRERGSELMQREFSHLQQARALGLDQPPYRVVRPLGIRADLDALLVEEFVRGEDLRETIQQAIHGNHKAKLHTRLVALAGLLAILHQRSCTATTGENTGALAYLARMGDQLMGQGVIDSARRQHLMALGAAWQASGLLHVATQTWVHGDATPSNLLFTDDHEVVAIDLERMHPADCALDLGCVAAELKHWFLRYTGDPWAGEWAIQHFYTSYRAHRHRNEADFHQLTRRGQFYMGSFLLRISRNSWLDWGYRQRLVQEAEQCLYL